jgi:poly(hydroxyalkanoate) depolymerase family esterase
MLQRIREFLARILRRGPPAPGRFVTGKASAKDGRLAAAPLLAPARGYLLYLPRGYHRWIRRPLVILIHGCRQTPEELAAGTRIRERADANGWMVLMPRQTDKANPWSCWNWFDGATAAGRGEAAIVMAQLKALRLTHRVHPRRIFAAGMSAGGSLAATLGVRYPETFAGVFVHSGLPCGAASSPAAALAVMGRGADTDPQEIGSAARAQAGGSARVPLLAVHGEEDGVVAEVNALQTVRQFLALNGRASIAGDKRELPPPDTESVVGLAEGREMHVADYRDGRGLIARLVRVPGLGHAWSGGDDAYEYNDADPPDATALLEAFVEGRLTCVDGGCVPTGVSSDKLTS